MYLTVGIARPDKLRSVGQEFPMREVKYTRSGKRQGMRRIGSLFWMGIVEAPK